MGQKKIRNENEEGKEEIEKGKRACIATGNIRGGAAGEYWVSGGWKPKWKTPRLETQQGGQH